MATHSPPLSDRYPASGITPNPGILIERISMSWATIHLYLPVRFTSRGPEARYLSLKEAPSNGHDIGVIHRTTPAPGKAWIGIVDEGGDTVTTFNVTAGQLIFFPKNALHWVKNVGDDDCLFFLFFSTHDELKTLDVDDAFFGTTEDTASRSLKPEGGVNFIRTFKRPKEDQAINLPSNLLELIQNATYVQSPASRVWRYFYDLKGSKEFLFPGGTIQWARYRKNGGGLSETEKIYSESINQHEDTLTLATLRIHSNGLRQPHFHFNAHELGYVISDCGLIGIVGAEPVAEFPVDVGDVFFFPIGTQHYIRSVCAEDLYMILAFNTGNQVFEFEGGAIQWARYRSDPQDYSSPSEMKFGSSINNHQSKMSAGTLRIVSKGLRAPHWHFNANEHGFLVQGKAWIGIVDEGGDTVTTFNVTAGQLIFFPKNALHWVKNVGDDDCLFFLFFSTHDELKTLDVDDAFFGTPEDTASRSLKPEGGVNFIRTFKRPNEDQAINLPSNLLELIQNATYVQSPASRVWRYFYDLKGSKEFLFPGGTIQWARYRKNGGGLSETEKIYSESINQHEDTLTLATLRIHSNGLRQPHFHFNAHELGYVISGCGLIGIVGAEPVAEFPVDVGDVFFFPIGTQHYIRSVCAEDLYMILAFNTGNQLETLDMDDYFHATSDHILAQLFNKKQDEFKKIPRFSEDQAVNIP
ncbi:uncharacterized protein RCH25_036710 [Pelodytes ibericus]